MKTTLIGFAITAFLLVDVLALDEIKATRNSVSTSGDQVGLHDLQFGVMVRGTVDEQIDKLERELRLLRFQRDVYPDLAKEITLSGSCKSITNCIAELSQQAGRPIPLDLANTEFVVGNFSFEKLPLMSALKHLIAFGGYVLDVGRNRLVCKAVGTVPGHPVGEPKIVQLIRNGDLSLVRQALDREERPISSIRDSRGLSLLHHAVWQNQPEIARLLLDRGIEVNATDETGTTPLHQAVSMHMWELIPLLLERNADPAIPDNWNDTPLETALYNGNTNVAGKLAKAGPPLDIFTAAGLGRTEMVKKYLEEGVEWRVRFEDYFPDGIALITRASDPRGRSPGSYMGIFDNSPLHWAAAGGSVEVAKLLIARGVPVKAANCHGETALHWAARGGSAEIVELLITTNRDVTVVDVSGQTPLHCAAQSGRLKAARVLISHAADVNAVTTPWKNTPLLLAARMADNPELIRLLIEAGANVNAVDSRGENALHMIAHFGARHTAETARMLIAAGASALVRNEDGRTPLEAAVSAVGCHGNEELVKVLQGARQDLPSTSPERKQTSQPSTEGDGLKPAP